MYRNMPGSNYGPRGVQGMQPNMPPGVQGMQQGMQPGVQPIVCPPLCRYTDSCVKREVPYIQPLINVNRVHIVDVPRTYYREINQNVVVSPTSQMPYGGNPYGVSPYAGNPYAETRTAETRTVDTDAVAVETHAVVADNSKVLFVLM